MTFIWSENSEVKIQKVHELDEFLDQEINVEYFRDEYFQIQWYSIICIWSKNNHRKVVISTTKIKTEIYWIRFTRCHFSGYIYWLTNKILVTLYLKI